MNLVIWGVFVMLGFDQHFSLTHSPFSPQSVIQIPAGLSISPKFENGKIT
jgi:hypothetical protein